VVAYKVGSGSIFLRIGAGGRLCEHTERLFGFLKMKVIFLIS
jgi:hypothetical protein